MNREERLDDREEAIRIALEGYASQLWTSIPAIVESVNLEAQTISAQPSIQGSVLSHLGNASQVNLPLLVDVPIVWPRAGGFALTFPVTAGDEVLVVFSSRCIDSWWQSGGVGSPAEPRMHDLSDGFAILAPTSQPKKLANVSTQNVQLRNLGGSTFLEITPSGKINIVAVDEINLTAPKINMNGEVSQAGGNMSIGGIVFGGHKHTGVKEGHDNSGGPIN